ncbi:DUF4350 domain-containing protein [Altibacter sp.]|uniref:DUF4350 domain-containing protein n=1 Tax=Altibacter sp. TaxID=2024823 RepID=UPI000C91BFA9|nr:DUF4350 domain-containing protein [Altibacter sp.]MAP55264.1 hypothetical protein [Altibacter sp.]
MKSRHFVFLCLLATSFGFGQQVADSLYNPPISTPAYQKGTGPVIFIDEGHFNFHTKGGRYKAFADLLERDGYTVESYKGNFTKESLQKGKILVISNALNEKSIGNWVNPTLSAFTNEEIEIVKNWVEEGGSLFLIADHMPLAGAAAGLASAFDIEFTNGFVFDTISQGPAFFNRKEGSLIANTITNGRFNSEKVTEVVSFTGQAFRSNAPIKEVLVLDERYVNLLPDTAWVFHKNTPRRNTNGWLQGAYRKVGKGRLVVFGEAAMFSAQLAGPEQEKMGMNNPIAPQNYQLLLNIIHWLDGKL